MKTLYLHIGHHKTGSTALQVFFMSNSDLLLSKGISYPMTGILEPSGHYYLAIGTIPAAKSHYTIDRYIPELEKETLNCPNIIISSEIFAFRKLNVDLNIAVEFLGKLADRIKIVVYLRRQDEWAQAIYAQGVNSWP